MFCRIFISSRKLLSHPSRIPTVYQRSSVRTKKWKDFFIEPVKGTVASAIDSENNHSVRKSDYVRSKPSISLYQTLSLGCISYLHKAVLDGKEGGFSNFDNKPIMLLQVLPGTFAQAFHGIAASNGLYTVSHGQKEKKIEKEKKWYFRQMLSIWPSRSAYDKARGKHDES